MERICEQHSEMYYVPETLVTFPINQKVSVSGSRAYTSFMRSFPTTAFIDSKFFLWRSILNMLYFISLGTGGPPYCQQCGENYLVRLNSFCNEVKRDESCTYIELKLVLIFVNQVIPFTTPNRCRNPTIDTTDSSGLRTCKRPR